MAAEDQVRELLRALTPQPEAGIEVDVVRRGARRRRSRRTAVAAAAAVAVAGSTVGVVSLAQGTGTDDPAPAPSQSPSVDPTPGPTTDGGTRPGWEAAPAMPLSPRRDPLTVWTGSEVLVIGGIENAFIGGPLPFPTQRDGAAYDPATGAWRSIARAPEAIGSRSYGDYAVVGDVLVLKQSNTWLAYDVGDDAWRELPAPPVEWFPQPVLAGDDDAGLLYAVDRYDDESSAPVQVLDLATDTWSALPASPHDPRIDGRELVLTDAGLVLIGGAPPDRRHPRVSGNALAEVWDGDRWTRFPATDLNGNGWHWTGERIITTYRIPEGGRNQSRYVAGALDASTGTWSELPPIPGYGNRLVETGYPPVDGPLVLQYGYLYDDTDGSSTPIPSPDDTLRSSGVALGDGLVMTFGGYHVDPDEEFSRFMQVEPTSEVWVYRLD